MKKANIISALFMMMFLVLSSINADAQTTLLRQQSAQSAAAIASSPTKLKPKKAISSSVNIIAPSKKLKRVYSEVARDERATGPEGNGEG